MTTTARTTSSAGRAWATATRTRSARATSYASGAANAEDEVCVAEEARCKVNKPCPERFGMCMADDECLTGNCQADGYCGASLATPEPTPKPTP
jgi:hypothetical protein